MGLTARWGVEAIGEQIVDYIHAGGGVMAAGGELHRRRFAGNGQQPIAAGVPGEVDQNVNSVGANHLCQCLVAHMRHVIPLVRGGNKLCGHRIRRDHACVTEDFKLFVVVGREDGQKEEPHGMQAQVGRHVPNP